MNGGIINSITRLHLVGYFYWVTLRCTDPWILTKYYLSLYLYNGWHSIVRSNIRNFYCFALSIHTWNLTTWNIPICYTHTILYCLNNSKHLNHFFLLFDVHVTVHHHHHHHISVMELGHLLTPSGLTYPEVSSKVCHDSFCQLGNSVSLPWVIYYGAFYLHVVFQ